ncbi:MAG: NAD(P)H-hydrate dehydratase [Acidimicrobiales bacterium]|nr:NAD(P)H-hydrate dehydratase [Acidimicrobiales bacterium]
MKLGRWRGLGVSPMPVLTPEQVRVVDSAAGDLDELIGRAGSVVARVAVDVLGGTYGRRVVVIAGPGNNGADGRVAAARLKAAGVRVELVDPTVGLVGPADLVIDAAFGTGLSRPYEPPQVDAGTPILAVDVPSGLDALTGANLGALGATTTVTFGAPKRGMFFGDGPELCGQVVVADIGLDLAPAQIDTWLVDDGLAERVLPHRPRRAHKWSAAVRVVAGSPGMWGAAHLTSSAAMRAGSGMVVVSGAGDAIPDGLPVEVVARSADDQAGAAPADARERAARVAADLDRFGSLVLGPGLGRDQDEFVDALVALSPVPTVIDADGLGFAWGRPEVLRRAGGPAIVTPHDGEFAKLVGRPPGPDRVGECRELATRSGAVVLLKGPTTVVASPTGASWLVTAGDQRLATAGSGDVLSGMLGAVLAQLRPDADDLDQVALTVACAAHWHGSTCDHLAAGTVASDIVDALARTRSGWRP